MDGVGIKRNHLKELFLYNTDGTLTGPSGSWYCRIDWFPGSTTRDFR